MLCIAPLKGAAVASLREAIFSSTLTVILVSHLPKGGEDHKADSTSKGPVAIATFKGNIYIHLSVSWKIATTWGVFVGSEMLYGKEHLFELGSGILLTSRVAIVSRYYSHNRENTTQKAAQMSQVRVLWEGGTYLHNKVLWQCTFATVLDTFLQY